MANNDNKLTVFQRLNRVLGTDSTIPVDYTRVSPGLPISSDNADRILYQTTDKADYERKKLELRQNKFLAMRWKRAQYDIANQQYLNLSEVKLMYRDADLMDCFPEIGAALDVTVEESCYVSPDKGQLVNVYSKSDRVKKILEDLLANRLQIKMTLPMVCRSMLKYGNAFMLLNIDTENGVKGWKELPVYNMERYENMTSDNPYFSAFTIPNESQLEKATSTRFVWVGNSQFVPYRNWEMAHFRLLYDSLMLPYGMSFLNKARRHWRLLSMMEDCMLMYRLERSIERRVFKVDVGAIDEDDVPAYIEQFANEMKRTSIVDPATGQIDLRKNILPVWKGTPIPLLDGRIITIEELAKEYENGATNYVHSIQDGTQQVVAGKVAWCGKNYTAKEMIKVTLDDDGYILLAPEHEFIMRDGSKKRADKLNVGDSIMPFYTEYAPARLNSKRKNTYLRVFNPSTGQYEFMHRLVAKEVERRPDPVNVVRTADKITIVHHIDYNRYNNTPENLYWCSAHEHKSLHGPLATKNNLVRWADPVQGKILRDKLYEYNHSEKHKEHDEIRRQGKKEFWNNPKKAKLARKRMTVKFDENVWRRIRYAIMSGIIYNRITFLDYVNTELIDYIISINTSQKLHNMKSISRTVLKDRIKELGYNSITDFIFSIHDEYGGVDPREVERQKKSEITKRLNANKRAPFVVFDDNIYNAIRIQTEQHKVNNLGELYAFLNESMIGYIREINNLPDDYVLTKDVITRRLMSLGFKNTTAYFEAMQKNHKVVKIEIVPGDDVYCMTVTGLHGEDDRHNFALLTLGREQIEHEKMNGIFVSNCQSDDYFIPTRDPSAPSPIETLPAAQNLTAIDDIQFIQQKLFTALRVPKAMLNYVETAGEGKNLSLLDVRFQRTVNKIQQMLLLELNKVCIIHLSLLGFNDELTNFTLSMNNPSSQAEMLAIENLAKKITTAKDAITDNGNGIPLMSVTRALKEIMGWSDKEIAENLSEIRIEMALAAELQKTSQIIKRTGIFDNVDNIYGEPGAEYSAGAPGEEGEGGPGGGGGGASAAMFGGDDMGGGDMPEEEDVSGSEGDMPMDQAANEAGAGETAPDAGGDNAGPGPMNESIWKKGLAKVLADKKGLKELTEATIREYSEQLVKSVKDEPEPIPLTNKAFFINEDLDNMAKQLDKYIQAKKKEEKPGTQNLND